MNSFWDKLEDGIKNLSIGEKKEILPKILKRDKGFVCFYCRCELKIDSFVYEHLNNNRKDNRKENIVLACQSCNNKKPYDTSMQEKAILKLKQNESNFMSEREISDQIQTKEASTEIDINVSNFGIVYQYITEVVNTDGFIPKKQAIYSGAFVCKKKTGHGAPQTVRNYIEMLVSDVGPFKIIRDENRKEIIVKRTDELTIQKDAKIDNFFDNSKVKK